MFRRRAVNKDSRVAPPPDATRLHGFAGKERGGLKAAVSVAASLLDYSLMLFLVFGGCCSYVSTSAPPVLVLHTQLFLTWQKCLGLRRAAPRGACCRCVGVATHAR